MNRQVDAAQAADILLKADNIAILCHKNPDGDTIGCGFAMYYALRALGKNAMVICHSKIPEKYGYITTPTQEIDCGFVLAVDIADEKLFGDTLDKFKGRVDLCIDHHPSNTRYAENTCLRYDYGAACELVFDVIKKMKIEISPKMADCIYTGIVTDTGCFRYTNTGIHTMETAAELMRLGAATGEINTLHFETKSKSRLAVEQMALSGLTYHFSDRCAMICVTLDMLKKSGATNEELEGVASIPRQIEGVDIGITIRQQTQKYYKISLRTSEALDAGDICKKLGGGGHNRAAGCEMRDVTLEQVKEKILKTVGEYLEV